jgi:ribonuclease Z
MMNGFPSDDDEGGQGLTRRALLAASAGMAGLAVAGTAAAEPAGGTIGAARRPASQRNTWFESLMPYYPGREPIGAGEMRISFMGTSPIPRMAQSCGSVFVELGNGDCFLFDAGTGVMEKYNSMKVHMKQMDRIFLTHLHGDHTSDLTHIFDFGPSLDRKSPLYVWGPTKSDIPDPVTGQIYDDGTATFCQHVRDANRWHTEAFSFLSTSYTSFIPPPWDPAGHRDGFDLVPTELPWRTIGGVAYDYNGVRVTHFPAVHDRQGSISYKLEWNGLSMVFSGDTKPTNYIIEQATDGVDVFIHEMVVPPEVWAHKNSGLKPGDPGWEQAVQVATMIENNAHTPQKAFGYLLNQLRRHPRLAIATHFQAEDDTMAAAMRDVRSWYPKGHVSIATDFYVVRVTKDSIRQRRAVVSDFAWQTSSLIPDTSTPKYHDANGQGDPYAQLDPNAPVIPESAYA